MEIDASLVAHVLDLVVTIQQIPAPPFGEEQRAAFIRERFHVEGLKDVSMDDLGNVYGCLPGNGSKPPLVMTPVNHIHLGSFASIDIACNIPMACSVHQFIISSIDKSLYRLSKCCKYNYKDKPKNKHLT